MIGQWRAWLGAMLLVCVVVVQSVDGLGVNWGTISVNPLPPGYVVKMLQANNITKVKLFDADFNVVRAMAGTNIEVMVAAPNDMLDSLANTPGAADSWVKENVTQFLISGGVNIKWVAVGNEPFLSAYNGSYLNTTLPALKNILTALASAGHADTVKAIIPFNADVLNASALPSQTIFKPEYMTQISAMLSIFNSSGAPFSINLYPFISKYNDPAFPLDYAFFDGTTHPVVDNGVTYTNAIDASYDALVSALKAAGYPNMSIIFGEIGWPTDGTLFATTDHAHTFNNELINHLQSGKGTPLRPNVQIEFYLFSLLDENIKSIDPGPFERHWGLFYYDGIAKYQLNLGAGTNSPNTTLQNAAYPPYMSAQYCVLNQAAAQTNLTENVAYACSRSDCTPLYPGSSCSSLTSNASYAFNAYFQFQNQDPAACDFQGLGEITTTNPSQGICRFIVGLVAPQQSSASRSRDSSKVLVLAIAAILSMFFIST